MATRTGRMVLDRKTGAMVEEVKEDQMAVALHDPERAKPEDHSFRFVLRSDFTLAKINTLFNCNAALLKDPFGNVLWPKDWMTQVLPPKGADKWFYVIHERVEPPPRDDLQDPLYSGGSAIVLSGVPIQCEADDLKTWLLFGIAQDFAPLQRVLSDMELARKKKLLLKQKLDALPTMDVEGSTEQQGETRKKLADAIESHAARYDSELAALSKRKARIERLLFSEPLALSPVAGPADAPSRPADREQAIETRTWSVQFTSSRGSELASIAMAKCDWAYVCLAQTRPKPTAFVEVDGAHSEDSEVNMRAVRLERLRHGSGELLHATAAAAAAEESGDTDAAHAHALDPSAEDFHFSSLGALYAGEFHLGEKHGRGREVTNAGIYEGEFSAGERSGRGKMVYGDGTTSAGPFAPASARRYAYGKRAKGKACAPSLLNGGAFRGGAEHGERVRLVFPDGATYEGEMADGRVTGWGRYVSSTGVVEEGRFVDGVLSGEGGRRELPNGAVERGSFAAGTLHGRGRTRDRHGDAFDGFFELGARHGRGRASLLRGRCRHVGFWRDGAMDGRGDVLVADSERYDCQGERDDAGDDDDDDGGGGGGEVSGGLLGGGRWRSWFEGGFQCGEPRASHRIASLSPARAAESHAAVLALLAAELPARVAKSERRARANARRRVDRERAFLAQRARLNLSLYYSLLDDFFEQWAAHKQFARRVGELESEAAREQAQQELEAQREFERQRERRREDKYGLAPPKRGLLRFEDLLERVTLREHTHLERAARSSEP